MFKPWRLLELFGSTWRAKFKLVQNLNTAPLATEKRRQDATASRHRNTVHQNIDQIEAEVTGKI